MRISDWSSDVCSSDLALQQQPWPGNVRELENCLWRLAVLAPGDTITAADVAQAQPAAATPQSAAGDHWRSEEHTSELQSLMRISYAVFCLKKKTKKINTNQ